MSPFSPPPPPPLPLPPPSLSRPSSRTVSKSSQGSGEAMPPKREPLTVDEDKHDQMRAGLISKAVDHVTLLVEDWFTGTCTTAAS